MVLNRSIEHEGEQSKSKIGRSLERFWEIDGSASTSYRFRSAACTLRFNAISADFVTVAMTLDLAYNVLQREFNACGIQWCGRWSKRRARSYNRLFTMVQSLLHYSGSAVVVWIDCNTHGMYTRMQHSNRAGRYM